MPNKLITFFALFICIVAAVHGQGVKLINADVQRGKKLPNGDQVTILRGNVHLKQDSLDLFCDDLNYYPREDKFVMTGNVRLHRGVERLLAQQVTYFNGRDLAIARRNVLVDRPGQQLRCQYLEYYYRTDRSLARTDVYMTDAANRAGLAADEGEYLPEENRFIAHSNAWFYQVDSTGTDTIHIYGQYMEYRAGIERRAIARDSVRIINQDLVAVCDSALYLPDQQLAYLEINPVATQLENRMVGEQMQLVFRENKIQRIIVNGRAEATSKVDSTGDKINKLAGRQIIAMVAGSQIDQLLAIDNARSNYYIEDQKVDQGMNTASADTIRIFFVQSELDSIAVFGGARGTYYPSDYQGKVVLE